MDHCHVLLLLSVLQRNKKSALVLKKKKNSNCCVSPPLAPQITLLSTSMMLGLPLAPQCFLLCPERQCSLRSLLLWFMNWDMFHQREWVPGGGQKGFDLTVLLKYDCKIRIRYQSVWSRDISVCPVQCLAYLVPCYQQQRLSNGWCSQIVSVDPEELRSCSLFMLLLIMPFVSCSIVTGPSWALWP